MTSGWGSWTWVTAICYGLLGVGAHYFFRNREASVKNFLIFGVLGTVSYDVVTMMIGPVFNAQPLATALAGQIPFTLMHILGTVVFATLLSPALYHWVVRSEVLEFSYLAKRAFARVRQS